jgi:hypothetical protein
LAEQPDPDKIMAWHTWTFQESRQEKKYTVINAEDGVLSVFSFLESR